MINVILRLLLAIIMTGAMWLGYVTPGMAQTPADDITPEQISQVETLIDKAFAATNAGDFAGAEDYWTQILEMFPDNPAIWSNRGNSKVSQNKLEEAIADYNQSIKLAPDVPDPYLNRGVALEGMKRWEEAISDYNRVLELDPSDPLAYNNRGNAQAGSGQWNAALADYQRASELEPNYAFARGNYALALYQIGETQKAIDTMKNLVRKYPQFADMRAALTAILWEQGKIGEAESHWVAAEGLDPRYKDLDWVENIRRWPPTMVAALDQFLKIK